MGTEKEMKLKVVQPKRAVVSTRSDRVAIPCLRRRRRRLTPTIMLMLHTELLMLRRAAASAGQLAAVRCGVRVCACIVYYDEGKLDFYY
jgi:hypothetical protein